MTKTAQFLLFQGELTPLITLSVVCLVAIEQVKKVIKIPFPIKSLILIEYFWLRPPFVRMTQKLFIISRTAADWYIFYSHFSIHMCVHVNTVYGMEAAKSLGKHVSEFNSLTFSSPIKEVSHFVSFFYLNHDCSLQLPKEQLTVDTPSMNAWGVWMRRWNNGL